MHQYPRAHVLSSLAVVLDVTAPATIILTTHEIVRIDRVVQSAAGDVTAERRSQVWTNRPSVWSQRPFRHPAGPPCPASAAVLIMPGQPCDLDRPHLEGCRPETKGQPA